MDPRVDQIQLPAAYGTATRVRPWADVQQRLEQAPHYWLVTVRPDGRAHAVPVDGLWLEDALHFGGHPDTVHERNLRHDPEVVVHLEDAMSAVIVEGQARRVKPSAADARRLSAASRAKYGYAPPADSYRSGLWSLAPRRVVAWTSVAEDPTRFTFAAAGEPMS